MLHRTQLDRQAAEHKVDDSIETAAITIRLAKRRVFVGGLPIALKPREFELLLFLVRQPDRVFTREQLLKEVWGYDFAGDTRTVDIHVHTLRKKLGDRPDGPRWIETVRGVGYRFREVVQ